MKRKQPIKSILAIVLCLALIMPYLPLSAFGAALDNFDVGTDFSGVKMSVIGDSISTYYGISNSSTYNPLYLTTSEATFGTYYGNTSHGDYDEFSHVAWTDTWWKQTVDTLGMDLLVNNAWSGSFVLIDQAQYNTTEYGAAAYKDRAVNLHYGSEKPDIIAVYLGTNDIAYYSTLTVGTKADVDTASERSALYTSVNNYATPSSSIEAYFIMLSRMIATYPDTEIYCMLPTICMSSMSTGRLNALNDFNAGVEYLVDYFAGLGKKVYLVDLNNDSGLTSSSTVRNYYYCNNVHPSPEGMDMITSCLVSELLEHSEKDLGNATTYEVTYNLSNAFVTTGLARRAVKGKSFSIDLLPYKTYQGIKLNVTMGGKDITAAAVDGDSINIANVTGPITITAKADTTAFYSWKATSGGWVSDHGYGYSYNKPTLKSGSYSAVNNGDGTYFGSFSSAQYTLDEMVVLQYTKPWAIEFKSDGAGTTGYANGTFPLSNTSDSKVSGNDYLYLDQTGLYIGYSDGSNYIHSGITWATIASKLGLSIGKAVRNDPHVYRIENRPNSSGTNGEVWLYVDGVEIGTMDEDTKNSPDITTRTFWFNYMGTVSFPLRSCSISYMKIWEDVTAIPDTKTEFDSYRWELSDSQDDFVNVNDDDYSENDLTMLNGSIADGTFTSSNFALDKEVTLLHDRLWSIEWETEGQWTGGGLILSSKTQSNTKNNVYLFRSSIIALGCSVGTEYRNYGITPADYGITRSDHHIYRLSNRINADGSNMVYLYVDDVELGPLNNYNLNGTDQGVTSNWISGQDFVFSYIGTPGHPVNDTVLSYLVVNEDCVHANTGTSSAVVTPPTCTEAGYTTYTCAACGESYVADEVAALGHSYEAVITPPTCTEAGYTTYTCSVCNHSYVADEIGALSHSYEGVITPPTCTTTGYTTYTCSACGDSYVADEVAALGHTWVDADCTTAKTCSVCGTTEGEALGHNYNAIVTAPTCTTAGYTTYICFDCGDSYVADEVAALGHSYNAVVTEHTCTTHGYTTYTCIHCDHSYIDDPVYAPGHTWVAADCETAKTCSVCGATEGEALGHSYEAVVTAPTCTEGGYTTYTCSACGDSYVADEVAALGHDYEAVVTAPTCTAGGYTTYTCSACGDSYVADEVAALGHSYESVVTAPTCTEGGYTTYTCSACGDSYVADEVAALGHTWVDADCETAKTCSVCGATEGEALGHSYEAVVTAPTCTEGGYTTYTCSACGDSYVADEVAAAGHSWTDGVCDSCGEVCAHSYVDGICSICGAELLPTLIPHHPSLSFEGEVFINVYFNATNIDNVVEMGLVTSADSVVDETDTKIPGYEHYSDTMYIARTNGISAKNLGDTIYFRTYAKLADGTYVYSEKTYNYSAVDYAKDRIANSTNAEMKALAVAMLNYGAAAQIHFGHNTDNLMNSSLTAEQLALVEDYRSDMVASIATVDSSKVGAFTYNSAGYSSRRPSVSFTGAFAINYYFTPALAVDNGMTLYYWTQAAYDSAEVLTAENASGTITMEQLETGEYTGTVSGISAKDIDATVFVAGVYESNGESYSTGVLAYSLGAYCVDRINKSTVATMVDFAKATAVYGYYAKEYFTD